MLYTNPRLEISIPSGPSTYGTTVPQNFSRIVFCLPVWLHKEHVTKLSFRPFNFKIAQLSEPLIRSEIEWVISIPVRLVGQDRLGILRKLRSVCKVSRWVTVTQSNIFHKLLHMEAFQFDIENLTRSA